MVWSEIMAFTLVAGLLVMSPGPNGLLIAKTVPISGRAAGFANIAGFVTAFYVQGALSILGISLLLVQSALAFAIVKFLGAAYLCWLGVKALMSALQDEQVALDQTPANRPKTLLSAYGEGFLTNALNPKTSMFYLAAFPQFITTGDNAVASAFLLVFVHTVLNALWFGGMVVLFAKLTVMAKNRRFQRGLKGLTGVIFIGFGVKLASYRATA